MDQGHTCGIYCIDMLTFIYMQTLVILFNQFLFHLLHNNDRTKARIEKVFVFLVIVSGLPQSIT